MTSAASGLSLLSRDWKEKALDGELELYRDFARDIVGYQKEDADKNVDADKKGPFRGFHVKIHAGLIAEFQVLADLPEHACYGVFAVPLTFSALVRFSNGDPHIDRDRKHEPRGIAIKLIGVEGRKLLPGHEDDVTQDFRVTSHSVTSAVSDVTQFIAFVKAQRGGLIGLFLKLCRALGWSEATRISAARFRTVILSRVRSMATRHFSGTAPIQCGSYAVKFTVRLAEGTVATTARFLWCRDFLRKELADWLRKADLIMDFLFHFYVDCDRTWIENISVFWRFEYISLRKVAHLRISRCDLDDSQSRELSEKRQKLWFSSWHATEDHKSLGNVMRARRVAYEASAALRGLCLEPTAIPI